MAAVGNEEQVDQRNGPFANTKEFDFSEADIACPCLVTTIRRVAPCKSDPKEGILYLLRNVRIIVNP